MGKEKVHIYESSGPTWSGDLKRKFGLVNQSSRDQGKKDPFEQDLNQQSTSASVPSPSLKTDMLHWKEHYQTAAIFVWMTQMMTIK